MIVLFVTLIRSKKVNATDTATVKVSVTIHYWIMDLPVAWSAEVVRDRILPKPGLVHFQYKRCILLKI